jgi:hypothetical protein
MPVTYRSQSITSGMLNLSKLQETAHRENKCSALS